MSNRSKRLVIEDNKRIKFRILDEKGDCLFYEELDRDINDWVYTDPEGNVLPEKPKIEGKTYRQELAKTFKTREIYSGDYITHNPWSNYRYSDVVIYHERIGGFRLYGVEGSYQKTTSLGTLKEKGIVEVSNIIKEKIKLGLKDSPVEVFMGQLT